MAEQVEVRIVNGEVSVDKPELDLRGKGPNVLIHWKIRENGWNFTANGIEIQGNTGQFTEPEPQGPNFRWKNKNNDHARYKYTVNVTNGTSTLSKDPFIINE
jgi:hypothetical protein